MSMVLLGTASGAGNQDFDIATGGPYDGIFVTIDTYRDTSEDSAPDFFFSPNGFTTTRSTAEMSQSDAISSGAATWVITNGTPAQMSMHPTDGWGNAAGRHASGYMWIGNANTATADTVWWYEMFGESLTPAGRRWSRGVGRVEPGRTEIHTDLRIDNGGTEGRIAVYGFKPEASTVLSGWEFVSQRVVSSESVWDIDLPNDNADDDTLYRVFYQLTLDTGQSGIGNAIQFRWSDDGGSTYQFVVCGFLGEAVNPRHDFATNLDTQYMEQEIFIPGSFGADNVEEGHTVWGVVDIHQAQNSSVSTKCTSLQLVGHSVTLDRVQGTKQGFIVDTAGNHDNIEISSAGFAEDWTGTVSLYRLKIK